MSPRIYGKRRDVTHKAIGQALESCGCLVLHLDAAIDMICLCPRSGLHLIEAKSDAKSRYTDTQKRMLADGWPLERLESVDDVVEAVMRWRKNG